MGKQCQLPPRLCKHRSQLIESGRGQAAGAPGLEEEGAGQLQFGTVKGRESLLVGFDCVLKAEGCITWLHVTAAVAAFAAIAIAIPMQLGQGRRRYVALARIAVVGLHCTASGAVQLDVQPPIGLPAMGRAAH